MGKRKVFVEIEMGELVPMMKATEEQMRSGRRVIINGCHVAEILTPKQLDLNYAEIEANFAKPNGGTNDRI